MVKIPRKVKIIQVDHFGYCGRDAAPNDSDIGLEVSVISILITMDGDAVLFGFTPDGRRLELVEHEVEEVS